MTTELPLAEPATEPGPYATRLSILMPVYNEERTVRQAIDAVLDTDLPFDFELIVVDDGSTDRTAEKLAEGGWPDNVSFHRHERNAGKGAAVKTALAHAKGEFAAIFDADLEYDPSDLNPLLTPLLRGDANAAFGVRAFNGHTSHSFLYVLGNRGVTLFANIIFNAYIGDVMTCHKAMRTDLFRSLPLRARGFEIEPEITARLLRRRERIYEIPVHYRARRSDEGKKLTPRDGVRAIMMLLRCRLDRRA